MKVHMAFCVVPDKFYKDTMYSSTDSRLAQWDANIEKWKILFGFSTDKHLMDDFCMIHQGLLRKKIELDEEEYKRFRVEMSIALVQLFPLDHIGKKDAIYLPLTKMEVTYSMTYAEEEYFTEYQGLAEVDPNIFNEAFQFALGCIDYMDAWYNVYATDEDRELYDYNSSFSGSRREYEFNTLGMLMMIYKYIIDPEAVYEYLQKEGV